MMSKLFFCVAVLVSMMAMGQTPEFRVMMNKGKNEVKSGAGWEAIKVGTSLKKTDEIRIGQNCYLGLVHSSGKPLEIKNAGNYKVSTLVSQVGAGQSVLSRYTDFILSNNTQKKGNLTATGAVHRGTNNIRIYLPAPENSYVFGDSIIVQWSKQSPGPYEVIITDIFSSELYKTETKENSIFLNLNDPRFNGENDIQLKVISKPDKKASEDYIIRKMTKANRDKLKPAYTDMVAQTSANTALNKFIQSGFFEQNKLFIEAATALQKAVKLEPGYLEFYNDFLVRNGMKDPKEK